MCAVISCAFAVNAETLRDDCWLWGHETGMLDGGPTNHWNLPPAKEYYHQVRACIDFGIANLCCVRWDMPKKEFRDSLAPLRRVTFPVSSLSDNIESRDRILNWSIEVAKEMPNMTGIDFDDFFRKNDRPREAAYSLEELKDVRRRVKALERPVEMRLVAYDHLFRKGSPYFREEEQVRPFVEQFDTILLWTWTARNLKELPATLANMRRLAGNKSILLGIYLWDFGGPHVEISEANMKLQLDFALEKWKTHEIDGVIFLATSICNRDFAAVRMARQWVRDNGDCIRGQSAGCDNSTGEGM